uniref:Uncharacterized protein n=1 Tax=Panagrolaimus sp. JU765 TaxID=591449 RepID=A0AC34QJQ5_9BILA
MIIWDVQQFFSSNFKQRSLIGGNSVVMLFMGGQQRPMTNYQEKYRDEESQERHTTKAHLRNITLAMTAFYLLVSLVAVAFYPPFSVVALIFPFLTLMLTFCASRGKNKDTLWPCILMASLGLLLKLVACIVFISIFGFSNDQIENPRPVLAKSKLTSTSSLTADMRAVFFGILTAAELFLLIVSCCVQWHLVAFKNCMET